MTYNPQEVERQYYVASIKKSQDKMNTMLANSRGIYEKVKAVRPLFLKVIRVYDDLKDEWKWNKFWRTVYKKSCEFLKDLDRECLLVELNGKELEYIKSFRKNLKKIKKMCEDTDIVYYSMLPDNIPIDVRTHCVRFISHAVVGY